MSLGAAEEKHAYLVAFGTVPAAAGVCNIHSCPLRQDSDELGRRDALVLLYMSMRSTSPGTNSYARLRRPPCSAGKPRERCAGAPVAACAYTMVVPTNDSAVGEMESRDHDGTRYHFLRVL
jgi:hypothetical protein